MCVFLQYIYLGHLNMEMYILLLVSACIMMCKITFQYVKHPMFQCCKLPKCIVWVWSLSHCLLHRWVVLSYGRGWDQRHRWLLQFHSIHILYIIVVWDCIWPFVSMQTPCACIVCALWPTKLVLKICLYIFRIEPQFNISYKLFCERVVRQRLLINQEVLRMNHRRRAFVDLVKSSEGCDASGYR